MASILYPLCAVLAWLAAFYRLPSLRRQKDASLLALCVAFMLLAATFTIATPTIYLDIDRLIGYPNISALVAQACALIFTAALQVMMLLWLNPREGAWTRIGLRSLAFALVLAAMAFLFLLTPTVPENTADFAESNAGQPYYAAYLLLYATTCAVMQIEIFRLCTRYARSCDRPWISRGLRTVMAGTIFGLIYCLARTADVAGALSGLNPRRWEPIAQVGAGAGEIFYLIGWTMPSWGPGLSAARAYVAGYRAHRQLYALWAALYGLTPQIALDPPRSRISDILNLRDLDFRLHRRVIEIQDGYLALRPYLPAVAADRPPAASPPLTTAAPPGRVDPAIAATQLRTAVDAKASNLPPATMMASVLILGGQGDLADEVKWLAAVARAFSRTALATADPVRLDDCAVRRCGPSGGGRPSPVACRSRSL